MRCGLVLLFLSLGCLLLAQSFTSLALLLIGTTIGGLASALGYRGALQVVNGIASPDHRAEVIASHMIACYLGNSVPVIGAGALSTLCRGARGVRSDDRGVRCCRTLYRLALRVF